MTIHDKYSLTDSSPFHLKEREEINITLKLDAAFECCDVLGRVFDPCGKPIEGATVKILTLKEKTISRRKTEQKGFFEFECMKPGKYYVAAIAEGYLLSELKLIDVSSKKLNRQDIYLKQNLLDRQGIIYGRVFDSDTCSPIANSEITLKCINEPYEAYASTYTNKSGQFLIYNIQPLEYLIYARHPEYEKSISSTIVILPHSKNLFDFSLHYKQRNCSGSISGKVTKHFLPVAHLPVFLYYIDEENEKLIKTQITNRKGLFYFDELPNGDYIVKAKLQNGDQYSAEFAIRKQG